MGFRLEFQEVQQKGKQVKYALDANVDVEDGKDGGVSVKVKNPTNHNLTIVERMI